LQVKARSDRGAAMLAVRRLVTEMDPRISANVNSLQAVVDFVRLGPRLTSAGSLLVALVSLAMASMGLYGVTAYVAQRRTKEIGIRMALGARPGHVLRMMVRQGAILVGWGMLLGLGIAWAAERVLASEIRLLPASSPATYLAVMAFLGAVAMLAMLAPSLVAARVNPTVALRHDG
jgi:ABC-type antimicrobial peptide transport system permease subunit